MSNKINMKTVDGLKQFVAFKGYDSTATYSLNDVVVSIQNDEVKIYQSLADNNTASLSDATNWKEVELGGAIDIDNSTISLNANEEIQTIGVIDSNNNTTALKLWTGTKNEYNAIQNKDPNTLYNITDDTGDLSEFANTDLSNLSDVGEAHFTNPALTNSPYTTNRILEIPQDIKLELVDGTLIIKSGTNLYVGDGNFTKRTLSTDIQRSVGQVGTGIAWICLDSSNNVLVEDSTLVFSGTTPPSNGIFFNTNDNTVKRYSNGSAQMENLTLPIAIVSYTNNAILSIDQIFNGFGYIGSTVFALPGVKVQTTFERNTDGTYKSEIWSIQSVLTKTRTTSGADLQWYIQKNISDGSTAINALLHYYSSSTIPSTGPTYSLIWCEEDGGWYSTGSTGTATKLADYYFLKVFSSDSDSTGKISNFKNCSVDSVANSNASNFSQAGRSYLSGIGMPSSRYIDLTVGATGSTYTAPANGYFYCRSVNRENGQFMRIMNTKIDGYAGEATVTNTVSGRGCGCMLPVLKRDTIRYDYNVTESVLRFIYAEGEG